MQLLPSHSPHSYNPEESPAGSASTRMLDTESSKKRLFIQSSVQRHSDHITAGGLGGLATMLLCPPCFLERARKPCAPPFPCPCACTSTGAEDTVVVM